MPAGSAGTQGELAKGESGPRLDSWKEIATYLKRDPRTVRRWERQEGLPVHRHVHGKRATVYVFAHEIDTWLQTRKAPAADQSAPGLIAQPSTGPPSELPQIDRAAQPLIIAFLPLRNLTGDLEQERFADGLTEEIILEAGHCCPKRLRVIALTSVMQYKQSPKSVAEIGRELGADYILEGGIRRYGRRIRLTTRLIAARDQAHVWADSYEVQLPPIFSLQQALARELTGSLSSELNIRPNQSRHRAVAQNVEAHSAYLKGCSHFLPTDEEMKKGLEHFHRAIRLDPTYAPAHADLGLAYFRIGFTHDIPPLSTYWRLEKLASTALRLDPRSARAHAAQATFELYYAWNWPKADASSRQAIKLNPSDGWGRFIRASYLLVMGELEAAMEEPKLAHQLDPCSLHLGAAFAFQAYLARRHDLAIKLCEEMLQLNPSLPTAHLVLGLSYAQTGDKVRALAHCEKVREMGKVPLSFTALACSIYDMAGQRDLAKRLYRELVTANAQQYMRYIFLAHASAGLGNNQQTLKWLEKAYEQRDPLLVFLKADPRFESLSGLPGFRKLLHRIGLPQ